MTIRLALLHVALLLSVFWLVAQIPAPDLVVVVTFKDGQSQRVKVNR